MVVNSEFKINLIKKDKNFSIKRRFTLMNDNAEIKSSVWASSGPHLARLLRIDADHQLNSVQMLAILFCICLQSTECSSTTKI